MSEENTFTMMGIKTQWDDNTITVTELGFPHQATFDNNGRILSSSFGKEGESFLHHWFDRVKPTVDGLRAIDREYADA
ncbi:hypothetical protein D2E25_0691 [Bifidobacterium goeldii]|uniref:Uncharacterized protein n=1 Tax=Bifidobacterium goeldii TaxID=2306975 RepID=A0A430FNG9_9BIFI|nr:hypothetical protein [Bifidobacterium goeldii]RSX54383.1 hypothetical protein D2E25_0691 [Bifidobacterium goeldii]